MEPMLNRTGCSQAEDQLLREDSGGKDFTSPVTERGVARRGREKRREDEEGTRVCGIIREALSEAS